MAAIKSTGPPGVIWMLFSSRTAKPSSRNVDARLDGHDPAGLHGLGRQATS